MIADVQEGRFVRLRPVTEEDAAFVLSLRLNPEYSRYLHKTSPDLENQKKWIREQRERAGDYYFVIEAKDGDKPVGLIGLYNIVDDEGEPGRWICPFNPLWALESMYLLYRFAFNLPLKLLQGVAMTENTHVLRFHRTTGADLSEPELIDGVSMVRVKITPEFFKKFESKIDIIMAKMTATKGGN